MLMDNALSRGRRRAAGALEGTVAAPGDQAYDEVRRAWNLAVDQRPALVAVPETRGRRRRRRRLRPRARPARRAAGHRPQRRADRVARATPCCVKTSALREVEIDAARPPRPRRRRRRCGPRSPARRRSTASPPLAGSSPDVGVVGYTLGGGLSWLGRRHGLAANSVLAIELVTADGRVVRADRDNEPELFWALRGGGGSFGIVTAMEFVLYPAPEVYAGADALAVGAGDARSSAPTSSGAARRPTRSRPPRACCRCRRCPTSRSPSAAASSWPSTAPTWATRPTGAERARPAARARAGDRHVRADPGRRAEPHPHGPGAARCPATATA